MLRIAVQTKGRLNEESMTLLKESGIKITQSKRKLIAKAKNFPLEVLFLRDDDIPQSVADGVADIGVVGENEFLEKKKAATILKRLGFSKCRLSLAIPKSVEYKGVEWFSGKKIATSYPAILQDFLDEKKIDASIHTIAGSVEIAPGIGLADAIFDIVSSGSTLVSNRLSEVEVVADSEAVLIENGKLDAEKQAILDELIFRIETVEKARDKKYIMMNVPNENIQAIEAVLPAMKSPTVVPLANEGWSSLQSVIDEQVFWNSISDLKKLGAESILLMPIEKIID